MLAPVPTPKPMIVRKLQEKRQNYPNPKKDLRRQNNKQRRSIPQPTAPLLVMMSRLEKSRAEQNVLYLPVVL